MDEILERHRETARLAMAERDAIEDCMSHAWRDAHRRANEAFMAAAARRTELASNPLTRYGSWRDPTDRYLMGLGYYPAVPSAARPSCWTRTPPAETPRGCGTVGKAPR